MGGLKLQGIFDITAILGGILLSLTLIAVGIYMIHQRSETYRGVIYLLIGLALAAILCRGVL